MLKLGLLFFPFEIIGARDGARRKSCDFRAMPNRGPLELSLDECTALLSELPEPDLADAENAEEKKRMSLQIKIRQHIDEPRKALTAAGSDGGAMGTVVLSIDEVDEIIDSLPPPPALGSVREKLATLGRTLREGA